MMRHEKKISHLLRRQACYQEALHLNPEAWENSSSSTTLPKFHIDIEPEKLPGPNRKEYSLEKPSIFRGELLNFGGVTLCLQ